MSLYLTQLLYQLWILLSLVLCILVYYMPEVIVRHKHKGGTNNGFIRHPSPLNTR